MNTICEHAHAPPSAPPPLRGSLRAMQIDPRPVTIPSPPSAVLSTLGVARWPTAPERRRALADALKARDPRGFEALWAWAWCALAELDLAAAPNLVVPGTDDPDGTQLRARAAGALEAAKAAAPAKYPPAVAVADLLGYTTEGIKQRCAAIGWPMRGQGRVATLEVTVLPPTETPAPPTAPSGPSPKRGECSPVAVLRALGVATWPEESEARKRLSQSLQRLDPRLWVALVRWAFDHGEGESREAMRRLGYHTKSSGRVTASHPDLADIARAPGGQPGVSPAVNARRVKR